MQQPNQRGGKRMAQPMSNPLAIRTKKHQLDKTSYANMALKQVWKREWWRALIPLVLLLLPAVFNFSWWWVAAAVVVTILYVLLRSAQVMGVTQVEQSNVLFERLGYEIDQRQILMKKNEREGMSLTWDMIDKARVENEAYLLYLRTPEEQLPGGWRGWLARNFSVPVFLHLPFRIFQKEADLKLMDSLLRRKNLIA